MGTGLSELRFLRVQLGQFAEGVFGGGLFGLWRGHFFGN
jgi:hypothetical protein